MIVAQELTKVFEDRRRGPVTAAADVSFECPAGTVFGFLGPNGAGKTTTLRMLSTLLRPTSGTASVHGFDVRASPHDVRRHIGFASGDTRLYDRLTPRETVGHFGRLYGLSETEIAARTARLFDLFNLGAYADTLNQRLSGGTRQKVSLARALIHDPPVLIVDEPTAGLDVLVARVVLDLLRGLRESGKTILLSTHVMSEAERLCDAVAVIHRGRVLARGTLAEIRLRTGTAATEDAFFSLIREVEADPRDGSAGGDDENGRAAPG